MRRVTRAIGLAAMVLVPPDAGHALQIDFSNTSYYVYSLVSESADGVSVSGHVEDSRSNSTGSISASTATAYASASAEVEGSLEFRVHSAMDGSAVSDAGLHSATAEGGFLFETWFVVN